MGRKRQSQKVELSQPVGAHLWCWDLGLMFALLSLDLRLIQCFLSVPQTLSLVMGVFPLCLCMTGAYHLSFIFLTALNLTEDFEIER